MTVTKTIKPGSLWTSDYSELFRVISVAEVQGEVWVHYRREHTKEQPVEEYSCYQSSFLQRFREVPDDCKITKRF